MRAVEIGVAVAWRARARAAWIAHLAVCVRPWVAARRSLARLQVVSEDALRASRRGDTVFVFGSGNSLNEIGAAEWEHIAEHDTFGFNWFVRQRYVRCDFHLVRQIADSNERTVWDPQIREYFELLSSSPWFANAVLLVQHELRARGANLGFQLGVVPREHRYFPWRTRKGDRLSRTFASGLPHAHSTLSDTINAAYLTGWRRIVLVGVDLYDRRYFWLAEGETRSVDVQRSATFADPHTQAATGLSGLLARWAEELEREGVALEVYNPRSLLAGTLPVYAGGPS